MEFIYTFILVFVIVLLFIGLTQSRATAKQIFERNLPLSNESFVDQSTLIGQNAGMSEFYNWGKTSEIPTYQPPSPTCDDSPPTCDDSTTNVPSQNMCNDCDILKNKNIKYFTLKSSIPACPDMADYVKKSEAPICPDIKNYIRKSEIPVCKSCPDMSQYVLKSSIPSLPECPKCPVCPVCPVCPEVYDRIEQDPRFGRAFANADIRRHPDISKYILKTEAQSLIQSSLQSQAKDLLSNLRCPSCSKDGKARVEIKDRTTGAIINPKYIVRKGNDYVMQAKQEQPNFSQVFPDLTKSNQMARQLPETVTEYTSAQSLPMRSNRTSIWAS